MEKTFFKECPVCATKSGFVLTEEEITNNEKYFCHECRKESKLSKWNEPKKEDVKGGDK